MAQGEREEERKKEGGGGALEIIEGLYLNGRGVDVIFLEDSKGFLKQFAANADGGQVGSIVVVKTIDVLHHTSLVSLDGRQDQQVLQVTER